MNTRKQQMRLNDNTIILGSETERQIHIHQNNGSLVSIPLENVADLIFIMHKIYGILMFKKSDDNRNGVSDETLV